MQPNAISALQPINSLLRQSLEQYIGRNHIVVEKEVLERPDDSQTTTLKVGTGKSKISINGELLFSDGFTACSPVVFFDVLNNYAMLMHIDAGICSAVYNQWEQLMMLPNGSYFATRIKGSRTKLTLQDITHEIRQYRDDVLSIKEVDFETGSQSYSVIVKPNEGEVLINISSPDMSTFKITDIGLTALRNQCKSELGTIVDYFKVSPQERINILNYNTQQ